MRWRDQSLIVLKLTNKRSVLGLTQADVGERAGVTGSMISAWETGKSEPRIGNALRWAKALGFAVEITELEPPAVKRRAAGQRRRTAQ